MAKPRAIDRDEELDRLYTIIDKEGDQGKIVAIIGPKGTGKTTFLDMLSRDFEDRGIIVIKEKILSADTPLSFFHRFFSNLESRVDSTFDRFKAFISDHSDIIKGALNVIGLIPGIPNVTSIVEPFLDKNQASKFIYQLEERFLNLLDELSKTLPNQKLIIALDDIDTSMATAEFSAVISDIHSRLPVNVMFVFTASDKLIESDEIIPLGNFDETEVEQFVIANLADVANVQGIIAQIADKSGGYPAALGWLWENYRRGEDIISLLSRLSKEGFLEQLQHNFLRLLTLDEQKVLHSCSVLRIAESHIISAVSGIDRVNAKRILEDFAEILVVEPVNYLVLTDKEILNLYSIHPTFKMLIELDRGIDSALELRAINYYAHAILEDVYPVRTALVGLMLERYDNYASNKPQKTSAQDFLSRLDLNTNQKLHLWFSLMEYLILKDDKVRAMDFVSAIEQLINKLDNDFERSYMHLWTKYYRCWSDDNDAGAASAMEELRMLFSSVPVDQLNENQKALQTFIQDYLKIASRKLRGEEISLQEFSAIFEQAGWAGFGSVMQNKVFQLLFLAHQGESFLAAGNIEAGYEILSAVYDEWAKLTEEEKKAFFQVKNQDYSQTEFLLIQRTIEYEFGIACLLKAVEISSKDNTLKSDVEALLLRSVDLLKSHEADKVRGRYYQMARQLLDQLNYPER